MATLHPAAAAALTEDRAPRQHVHIQMTLPEPIDTTLYIAGSFSDPPWNPLPMVASYEAESKADTEDADQVHTAVQFRRGFDLPTGEYQYKFRIGEGDRWITDEKVPTKTDEHGNINNTLLVKSVSAPELSPATSSISSVPASSRRRRSSARQSPMARLHTPGRIISGRSSNDFSDYDVPNEVFEGDSKRNSPRIMSASVSRNHSAASSPHPSGRHESFSKSRELEAALKKVNISADQERTSRLEKFESSPRQDKFVTATKPSSQVSPTTSYSNWSDAKIRKMMTPILEKPNQFDEAASLPTEADTITEEKATSVSPDAANSHDVTTKNSPPKKTLLERRAEMLKPSPMHKEAVMRSDSDLSENSAERRANRIDSGYTSNDDPPDATVEAANTADEVANTAQRLDKDTKMTDIFSDLGPAAEIENHPSLNSPFEELCPLFEHESRSSAEGSPTTPKKKMRTMSALVREKSNSGGDPFEEEFYNDPDKTIAAMLDDTKRNQGKSSDSLNFSPVVSHMQDLAIDHEANHLHSKTSPISELGPIREDAPADITEEKREQGFYGSANRPTFTSETSPNRAFLPLFDNKNRNNDSPEIKGGRINATPGEELEELPLAALNIGETHYLSNMPRRQSNNQQQQSLSPVKREISHAESNSSRPESRKHRLENGDATMVKNADWTSHFPKADVKSPAKSTAAVKVVDFVPSIGLTEDKTLPEAKRVRLSSETDEDPELEQKHKQVTTVDRETKTGAVNMWQIIWRQYMVGIIGAWFVALFAAVFGGGKRVKGQKAL